MVEIEIKDDFDLKKIVNSGQCFRAEENDEENFIFLTQDHLVNITKIRKNLYRFDCSREEFDLIWFPYFDLGRTYKDLIKKTNNNFINKAIYFGKGIRILKQDPWETLISYIISQNKNIPAIKNSINLLSKTYGHLIGKDKYSFPTSKELKKVSEQDLRNLKLGYRSSYIVDAVDIVNSGKLDLKELENLTDDKLLKELMQIKGVGPKVAHCVGLFGYNRISMVPQDVWIKRTIQEEFNGKNLFEDFGPSAGIIQQYIFYYQRNKPKKD